MNVTDGVHAFLWESYSENNCNTYLLTGEKNVLVDPGHRHLLAHVDRGLEGLGLSRERIDAVLITHAHPDHLEAIGEFAPPALFAMNQEEYELFSRYAAGYMTLPEPDFFLGEGDLAIGDIRLQVILAPGHSPASVCLYWPEKKVLIAGDVVFAQGIGRTDMPGGSGKALMQSIRRLAALDVEYLLTGHGGIVAGKAAVKKNFADIEKTWFPYLR
jgi:glyoxylase-like metal-dependent hydrolase (beta-lactamase superfamily II)